MNAGGQRRQPGADAHDGGVRVGPLVAERQHPRQGRVLVLHLVHAVLERVQSEFCRVCP